MEQPCLYLEHPLPFFLCKIERVRRSQTRVRSGFRSDLTPFCADWFVRFSIIIIMRNYARQKPTVWRVGSVFLEKSSSYELVNNMSTPVERALIGIVLCLNAARTNTSRLTLIMGSFCVARGNIIPANSLKKESSRFTGNEWNYKRMMLTYGWHTWMLPFSILVWVGNSIYPIYEIKSNQLNFTTLPSKAELYR